MSVLIDRHGHTFAAMSRDLSASARNSTSSVKLGPGRDLQDKVSNLIGIFQDVDFTGSWRPHGRSASLRCQRTSGSRRPG